MIIYGVVDSQEDDFITYYLNKDKAIEELKEIRNNYEDDLCNPIMYDVDMCVAQFSRGKYHHFYIIEQEVIE